ncbi:MAG: 50S ribosomal protein L21 [Candidatus Omnitrophota bacterium]|nr:50S ribosomal protein L21 [Candidatus Omnitrophota bacterium]
MYAIIEVGGKQYVVKEGDKIEVEKQEAQEGKKLTFKDVLLVSEKDKVEIGQPHVKGASVETEILGATKGEKLISYKYRRRKSSHWTKGHRQQLTLLKISKIKFA